MERDDLKSLEILEVTEDSILFCTEDGKNFFHLKSRHEVDFWEECYLSFEDVLNCNVSTVTGKPLDIYRQRFDFSEGIPFKMVSGQGILLMDTEGNKFLINGYNVNNGYYSCNLSVVFQKDGEDIYAEDISSCQNDVAGYEVDENGKKVYDFLEDYGK